MPHTSSTRPPVLVVLVLALVVVVVVVVVAVRAVVLALLVAPAALALRSAAVIGRLYGSRSCFSLSGSMQLERLVPPPGTFRTFVLPLPRRGTCLQYGSEPPVRRLEVERLLHVHEHLRLVRDAERERAGRRLFAREKSDSNAAVAHPLTSRLSSTITPLPRAKPHRTPEPHLGHVAVAARRDVVDNDALVRPLGVKRSTIAVFFTRRPLSTTHTNGSERPMRSALRRPSPRRIVTSMCTPAACCP